MSMLGLTVFNQVRLGIAVLNCGQLEDEQQFGQGGRGMIRQPAQRTDNRQQQHGWQNGQSGGFQRRFGPDRKVDFDKVGTAMPSNSLMEDQEDQIRDSNERHRRIKNPMDIRKTNWQGLCCGPGQCKKENIILQQLIQEEIEKGTVELCSPGDISFYSLIFLFPKSNGGFRKVMDSRTINSYAPPTHSKMNDWGTIREIIQYNDQGHPRSETCLFTHSDVDGIQKMVRFQVQRQELQIEGHVLRPSDCSSNIHTPYQKSNYFVATFDADCGLSGRFLTFIQNQRRSRNPYSCVIITIHQPRLNYRVTKIYANSETQIHLSGNGLGHNSDEGLANRQKDHQSQKYGEGQDSLDIKRGPNICSYHIKNCWDSSIYVGMRVPNFVRTRSLIMVKDQMVTDKG
ncbi:MAG: hypothetical protein EZS28_014110 [Streblomastix strix]|uniref:Uncharacterized protein n=1 Tax=Streblomastix strix TaxID=222440 RepID=A0A5J4W6G0_9EUKA|nr:MAG: hypothetical protein EZS28_014110 [Streblomastix strix]